MSNLTSGSIDYFPLIKRKLKPNQKKQYAYTSLIDVVEDSAENVISNGGGNYIGEECKEINILNSSGCTVTSGVIGVNLFACSGISVYESNVIYIKNVKITEGNFLTSGVTFDQSLVYTGAVASYDMTTDNYTVVVTGQPIQLGLPPAAGQTQVYNVKNITGSDLTFYGDLAFGTDTIENETSATIPDRASLTLQSNGSTNYIII